VTLTEKCAAVKFVKPGMSSQFFLKKVILVVHSPPTVQLLHCDYCCTCVEQK